MQIKKQVKALKKSRVEFQKCLDNETGSLKNDLAEKYYYDLFKKMMTEKLNNSTVPNEYILQDEGLSEGIVHGSYIVWDTMK